MKSFLSKLAKVLAIACVIMAVLVFLSNISKVNTYPNLNFFGRLGKLFDGVLSCLITAVILGIISSALKPKSASKSTSTKTSSQSISLVELKSIKAIANEYSIPVSTEPNNYNGYQVIDHSTGAPSKYSNIIHNFDYSPLQRSGFMKGVPGIGLGESGFGQAQVSSGQKGEQFLARIIASEHLPVVSYWSLYGFDKHGNRTEADIDCVLIGALPNGRMKVWLVDAKNYAGGSDTVYCPVAGGKLIRVNEKNKAFFPARSDDGLMTMSGNMGAQQDHISSNYPRMDVSSQVVLVPNGSHGAPHPESGLTWPGGVPCITIEELIADIRRSNLQDPQRVLNSQEDRIFSSHLKH